MNNLKIIIFLLIYTINVLAQQPSASSTTSTSALPPSSTSLATLPPVTTIPDNKPTIAQKPLSSPAAPTAATMQNQPDILPTFPSPSAKNTITYQSVQQTIKNNGSNSQTNSQNEIPTSQKTQSPTVKYITSTIATSATKLITTTLANSSVQIFTTVVPSSKVVVIPTTSSPSPTNRLFSSANSFLLIDAIFERIIMTSIFSFGLSLILVRISF
ncbi:8015_t:CDS:2 [Ambispora gerdemannii]|uniref:8015_t:CDS:1 n=1 Tax=Ambispora gerdemannii TaxID=144530 RepID=A0A9N9CYJ6_9GLOM|nr:8015_t:CDS:2 [Ambispora gerdemannii]